MREGQRLEIMVHRSKAATLPDGSEVVLRESTTKGFTGTPTLEFRDNVGQVVTKVRY